MKMKRLIAILLVVLMTSASLPMSAFAEYLEHAVYYYGTDNNYKINYSADIAGVKNNFFWQYTHSTKTLYIDTTYENGTIANYSRESRSQTYNSIIPTYITAINVNSSITDETIAQQEQRLRDNGWSEERIKAITNSIKYTTDENGNNVYGSVEEYFWDGSEIVEHLIIGKNVKSITSMQCGTYLHNLKDVTFEEGCRLEEIGPNFLKNANYVKSIELPSSLKTVGKGFMMNSGITSIDLSGTGITELPESCFESCTKLTSITLNDATSTIGARALLDTGITSIALPDTVTELGSASFYNTKQLRHIDIPSSLNSIAQYAFAYSGIEEIDLSGGKTYVIGTHAFYKTDNLVSVVMPKRIKMIQNYTFAESAISEITIPYVETICSNAFENTNLTSVTIPESCTLINKNAFYNNSKLSEIVINSTAVTFDGSNPFNGSPLKSFTMKQKTDFADERGLEVLLESNFLTEEGLTVYGYTTSQLGTYCSDNNINFVDLDDKAEEEGTEVSEERYETNKSSGTWAHGTFTVNDNVLTIEGDGKMLSNVITDKNGTKYTVAEYCTTYDIRAIDIKDGVKRIPNNFLYVDEDTSIYMRYIYLPYDLESIGDNAFRNVNCSQYVTQSYAFYANYYKMPYLFENAKISILPEHVKEIGKYAFAGTIFYNYDITLVMPNDLEEISEGLFYGSQIYGIEFEIPALKSVGAKAFADCPNLTSMLLSYTVEDIYEDENDIKNNAFGILENGEVNPALTVYTAYDCIVYDYCQKYGITTEETNNSSLNGTISTTATTNQLSWQYFNNTNSAELSFVHKKKPLMESFMSNYHNKADKDTVETYYSITTSTREEELAVVKETNMFNGLGVSSSAIPKNPYENENNLLENSLSVDTLTLTGEKLHMLKVSNLFAPFNPKSIILPDSIKYIDYNVFGNCNRLESIALPDSVIEIGSKAFYNCPALEYVDLGNGITEIPTKIFYNTKSLRFVDIGTGVTTIKNRAFSDCTALEEIVIPDNVETIESEAFYNCIKAQHIDIGNGVKTLGDRAFSNAVYCEEININSDSIDTENLDSAFIDVGIYTDGVTVKYGENVSKIDMKLLRGLHVRTLVIGKNVSEIVNIEYTPTSLEEIIVSDGNTSFTIHHSLLYKGTELVLAPRTLKTVSIASDTTVIGESAFENCIISSVSIPKSVNAIEKNAFSNCDLLKTASLGKGVKVLGEGAFENDTSLRLIYIPENVTTISARCFRNCTDLSNVTFVLDGANLDTIGAEAFLGCTSLTTLVFPESFNEIGDYAFRSCSSLGNVYIWNTEISENSFDTNNDNLIINTMAGSPAHAFARTYNVRFNAYTDEDAFLDECVIKLDELAGYVGYCDNGHGNIQYLTVYEADCENEGYVIGVCEFCSEILEEVHVPAIGHNKHEVVNVPATATTRGFTVEKCTNCGESFCTYEEPTSDNIEIETHTVSGKVTVAQNTSAKPTNYPISDVKIIIDGLVVGTTDNNGNFTISLETGSYEAELRYTYGISRNIYFIVEDEDIYITEPISMIACDFNKDNQIDSNDMTLFRMVISSSADDVSYLRFVDMNNDGYINGRDQAYITSCMGIIGSEYEYQTLIFRK